MFLPTFLRSLVPPTLKRWKARRQLRVHAARLAALRPPAVAFAELCRASRESGWYATLQAASEIVGLSGRAAARGCQTLLEFGTASSGTLYLLTRAASRHATLISADLISDPDRSANLHTFALEQQRPCR